MFPVEEKIGEIGAALAANRPVVLTAPPGSGKTTCVPPALLDAPWLAGRKIVMLEPRRLAARNCAAYIARRRGEAVGETVGYQVRLERKVSAATRLEIVTEGLLAQRLLTDPELADTGLVIFDEFHERSLACDLAFALALDVRRALRPDLRILVMSATLDADEVSAHLTKTLGDEGGARGDRARSTAVIRAEGRMFPVETKYLGDGCPMVAAISKALAETDGDVLCFLPGEGEIRRCLDACGSLLTRRDSASTVDAVSHRVNETAARTVDAVSHRVSQKIEILPLYGSLPKEEQDKVFASRSHSPLPLLTRKVVLATSIAETSVTLEGVTAVVDSGLMRVPRFSPGTGMTGLVTLPLTRDRAEQRRGRAGRVRAGVCYRLWSEAADASRPAKSMPEILDADLASLVLSCASWGARTRDDLPWMTPPPASAWEQARGLLALLGAFDARGQLTERGRAMARLAMHPRLANMMISADAASRRVPGGEARAVDAASRRVPETAALLAAIVEEGGKSRETDIRKLLDLVRETPNRPDSRRVLQLAKRFGGGQSVLRRPPAQPSLISLSAAEAAAQRVTAEVAAQRVTAEVAAQRVTAEAAAQRVGETEGSLLARAYPDRVAKNRGNATFQMVSGRGAFLDPSDALAKSPYLVCCELDDRPGDAKIFLACPIGEDEIEELFADQIVETPYCAWDRANERVKAVVRRKLGAMTLREKGKSKSEEGRSVDEELMIAALLDGVRQKGIANLPCWTKESLQLRARVRFLARTLPPPDAGSSRSAPAPGAAAPWPVLSDEEILAALPGFVSGLTKWRDLEKIDLFAVIDFILSEHGHDRRELDRLAPTRMEVPSGSHTLIHYEGDEPTCEVRLQECFGLMETPKVAGGRVPVVMTLLSPAQRPVQVTKDLAGFWRGAYQLVRKDMRGRYPKHYWPEDPFTAVATRRVRPRRVPPSRKS